MTQESYPWSGSTTGDCGPYTSTEIAKWNWMFSITNWSEEGVLYSNGFDENLNCTGATTPITAHKGLAIVRGRFYENDTDETFAISTPSAATRNDLLILRSDYAAQTIRLAVLTGTEGGGDPTLTQVDGTKWEIALWRVSINTGGAITLTDLRDYCHFRTKISMAQLDDGILANSTAGRLKMADGFLSADSAGRAKMASSYIQTAKLEDGILTADAAGRLKMADDFVDGAKLAHDIDAKSIGFSAAKLCGREPNRDFYRTDSGSWTEDDEFNDGTIDSKWTISGSVQEYNEATTWKSHLFIRYGGAGEYLKLTEPFNPGTGAYTVSALLRYGVWNTAAYCHLAVYGGDTDAVALKIAYNGSTPGKYDVLAMKYESGGWATWKTTEFYPMTTLVPLIKRDGNAYTFGLSTDGYSFIGMGSGTKVLAASKLELFMYFGNADIMASTRVGIDWIRLNWDNI